MTDLPEHACHDRALVVLGGLADAAEAERAQGAAVALALADLAADLRDAELRHDYESFFLRPRRRFGFCSSTTSETLSTTGAATSAAFSTTCGATSFAFSTTGSATDFAVSTARSTIDGDSSAGSSAAGAGAGAGSGSGSAAGSATGAAAGGAGAAG